MSFRPGMVFAVKSDSWLAGAINACQRIRAVDDESTYNHAGLITDNIGTTFEALSKIGYSKLGGYTGCRVIIAQHVKMTGLRFEDAFSRIKHLDGCIYPFPRLFLHLLGLAKYVHWRYPVCSELVGKFEFEAGLRKNWWGINPDNLADEWKISRYYDIVYEGVL
jgi:hypothetical protein